MYILYMCDSLYREEDLINVVGHGPRVKHLPRLFRERILVREHILVREDPGPNISHARRRRRRTSSSELWNDRRRRRRFTGFIKVKVTIERTFQNVRLPVPWEADQCRPMQCRPMQCRPMQCRPMHQTTSLACVL